MIGESEKLEGDDEERWESRLHLGEKAAAEEMNNDDNNELNYDEVDRWLKDRT